MKLDYKSAKEVMAFNTANEWHKAPVKDNQKTSIGFENQFIAIDTIRSANDF